MTAHEIASLHRTAKVAGQQLWSGYIPYPDEKGTESSVRR